MPAKLREELDQLLGGMCNGTLSAGECERLDGLLQTDLNARHFYNNYMFLHAEMFSQHVNVRQEAEIVTLRPAPRSSLLVPRRWLAIAAALVGVAAFSSWMTYALTSGANRWAVEAVVAEGDPAVSVAKITATRNCLWELPTQGIGFGSRLYPGQRIELAAGLIEITFDDGATVVLEGPAKFDVQSAGKTQLHDGRLAAIVPEEAKGFAVATSRLNVVDYGTEFGVMADEEGATEVHVFNGLVKAQLLDESGKQIRTVELNSSEAARIQPVSATVARIPARDDQFVRTLSVTSGPHDGLLVYDGFNYPSGPLGEQNGGFGWAGAWTNIESKGQSDQHTDSVKVGSLEYEGMVPVGNRAIQTAQENRIRRALSTSIGGVFDAARLVENQDGVRLVGQDGTTVYLSFLQRVDKPNDVFYGFELHRGDGNANRVLCIGNGADGCGYGVTSNFNVYGLRNFPALGDENTATNFYVIRITFGPGNRDHVEVMRNPKSLVDEAVCVVDAELTGNFAFDRISLGNFKGTKVHEVDEVRVGTTFRAVTGRQSRGPDRLVPRVAVRVEWRSEVGDRGSRQYRELAMVSWPRTADYGR